MASINESEDESPLIKALPPASDYLTYLTIIEYNLTTQNLPILHRLLQEETLTTNIGWDLVHLLVPLLPESEQCLHDIARLGNPREVILKVTESLRLIEYDQGHDEGDIEAAAETEDVRSRAEASTYPTLTARIQPGHGRTGSTQMVEIPPTLPLPIQQFISLLSMIAVLHPRIKSKCPSRFLSTSLQAVLASFSNASSHREEMIEAIVRTVKAVGAIKRPTLPLRTSSGSVTTLNSSAATPLAADPEGSWDAPLSPEEIRMRNKLLQSFLTHVMEEYMLNLPGEDDVPGMALCSRTMEKMHPHRTIPETKTFAERFSQDEKLSRRVSAAGQLVHLAKDLELQDQDLLTAASTVEIPADGVQEEDDPPTSANDVPLSRLGSLLLYASRQVSRILYQTSDSKSAPSLTIFPKHSKLLNTCLASHAYGAGQLGTEPEPLVDALLALGIVCLERDEIGEPTSDDEFTEYLQITALLSSNCPSPNLRGHAHFLSSTVLRSHPDDNVRLAFIRDTLEHCPFENLKVSAVGWIKGETIEANPPTPIPGTRPSSDNAAEATSIFATPLALDSLAPHLFPSLNVDLLAAPLQEAWQTFGANVSFYLASLNFVYLLFSAKHLHHSLGIVDLWKNVNGAAGFIDPLVKASTRFREAMQDRGPLVQERDDSVMAELTLLDDTLKRVKDSSAFIEGRDDSSLDSVTEGLKRLT